MREKKRRFPKDDARDRVGRTNVVIEENPMVKFPQLPDGWVKQTITGDASYDETVNEISNKLKATTLNIYLNDDNNEVFSFD